MVRAHNFQKCATPPAHQRRCSSAARQPRCGPRSESREHAADELERASERDEQLPEPLQVLHELAAAHLGRPVDAVDERDGHLRCAGGRAGRARWGGSRSSWAHRQTLGKRDGTCPYSLDSDPIRPKQGRLRRYVTWNRSTHRSSSPRTGTARGFPSETRSRATRPDVAVGKGATHASEGRAADQGTPRRSTAAAAAPEPTIHVQGDPRTPVPHRPPKSSP